MNRGNPLPINMTEFEIGDWIYYRGPERTKTIYGGEIVGIWVDRLWVVPRYRSERLREFHEYGRAEPFTVTQHQIWAAEPSLPSIPLPWPHELTYDERPLIPADLA